MLHKFLEPGDWFAPKRFGYGAGLPSAWQGWVVLGLFTLATIGIWLVPPETVAGLVVRLLISLALTIWIIRISAKRTRGGWRWRNGED